MMWQTILTIIRPGIDIFALSERLMNSSLSRFLAGVLLVALLTLELAFFGLHALIIVIASCRKFLLKLQSGTTWPLAMAWLQIPRSIDVLKRLSDILQKLNYKLNHSILVEQFHTTMDRLNDEVNYGVSAEGYPLSIRIRLCRCWVWILVRMAIFFPAVFMLVQYLDDIFAQQEAWDAYMVQLGAQNLFLALLDDYIRFTAERLLAAGILIGLIFSKILALLWFFDMVIRATHAFRQKIGVHFHPKPSHINTEPSQCRPECAVLRQRLDERLCVVCKDADADSILLDCGHVDMCGNCLKRFKEEWFITGETEGCPGDETRCELYGKVHVHCCVCRGGGRRRKVFFP
jgi:hypothetical protein